MAVVSLGKVAEGSASGSVSTLVMPITTAVPRSDPTLGGTIIVVYQMVYRAAFSPAMGVGSDDADLDDFYGTCYYTDGLNHWGAVGIRAQPYNNYNGFGSTDTISPKACAMSGNTGTIVLNPLTTSNSITLTFGGAVDYVHAFAVAYTGLQLPGRRTDWPPDFWHLDYSSGGFYTEADPLSGGVQTADQVRWCYNQTVGGGTVPNVIGPPYLMNPGRAPATPTPYPDYEWIGPGDLAVYCVGDVNHGGGWGAYNPVPSSGPVLDAGDFETSPSGAWSWGGSMSTVFEIDDDGQDDFLLSMCYAEGTPAAFPYTEDLTGSWAGIASTYTFGAGAILHGGAGPAVCEVPPPPTGDPVFHHVHRGRD